MFYLFIIAIAIPIAIAIAIIIWNSKTLEVMHMHINPVIYELQVSGLCPWGNCSESSPSRTNFDHALLGYSLKFRHCFTENLCCIYIDRSIIAEGMRNMYWFCFLLSVTSIKAEALKK